MDTTQLLSQFADDTDLFLLYDQDSLNATMETLDRIHFCLGLKINYDKTSVYRIGSLKNSQAQLYTQKQLLWTNEPVKVLGVYVANNINEVLSLNYHDTLLKVDLVLDSWSNRNLTLSGKVLTVNSLVASLFVYKMSALPILPNEVIEEYDARVNNFLWKGKRPKIPKNVLRKPREHGGLRLADLKLRDLSIKIQWVHTIQNDTFFAKLAYSALGPLGQLIWECNLHTQDVGLLFRQSFWRDVLIA